MRTVSYTHLDVYKRQVLSSSAEEQISLYNANWDYRYNSLIAVLMVDSLDGQDIESYAYDQGTQIGLGQGDALLVAAVDDLSLIHI